MAVYRIFTGPQNAEFKGSKYVSTKKPQYKRAREKFRGLQYMPHRRKIENRLLLTNAYQNVSETQFTQQKHTPNVWQKVFPRFFCTFLCNCLEF